MFTPDQKFQEGQEALRTFYNETLKMFPNSPIAEKDFNYFINFMRNLPHFKDNSVQRLGDAILISEYPSNRVQKVMRNLADAYEGRFPDARGANEMLTSLANDAVSISYMGELAAEAIAEGAGQLKSFAIAGIGGYALIVAGIFALAIVKR